MPTMRGRPRRAAARSAAGRASGGADAHRQAPGRRGGHHRRARRCSRAGRRSESASRAMRRRSVRARRDRRARRAAAAAQPQIVTPERALGEAVRAAATKQSSLAPLSPTSSSRERAARRACRRAVRAAAAAGAALRVPLTENLTAADVKQAFVRSGVLFEPRVAAGKRRRLRRARSAPAPAPAGDLKAALLVFREVLKTWAATPRRNAAPRRRSSPPTPDLPMRRARRRRGRREHQASRQRARGRPGRTAAGAAAALPEQAANLAKNVATRLHGARCAGASRRPRPRNAQRSAAALSRRAAVRAAAARCRRSRPIRRRTRPPSGCSPRPTARSRARPCCRPPRCPDQPGASALDPAAQRWTFEMPFATPQGTGDRAVRGEPRRPQAAKSDAPACDLARALLARRRADGAGACAGRARRRAHQRHALGRAARDRRAAERQCARC